MINTSSIIKKDMYKLTDKINRLSRRLETLNNEVEDKLNDYYYSQANSIMDSSEVTAMASEIGSICTGENGLSQQDKLMTEMLESVLTGITSRRIPTGIRWENYWTSGELVLYRRGIGYLSSWSTHSTYMDDIYDKLNVLAVYGNKLIKLINNPVKKDILKILIKYAKKQKFTKFDANKLPMHRCDGKIYIFNTDSKDNYKKDTIKFNNVGLHFQSGRNALVSVEFDGSSYYSKKIPMVDNIPPIDLYELSSSWSCIRSDLVKARNMLTKLRDDRAIILNNMTNELSPYLLVKEL